MMPSVTYLSYKIGADGLHPLPEKVEAIVNVPHPTGVASLSTILAPLYKLL